MSFICFWYEHSYSRILSARTSSRRKNRLTVSFCILIISRRDAWILLEINRVSLSQWTTRRSPDNIGDMTVITASSCRNRPNDFSEWIRASLCMKLFGDIRGDSALSYAANASLQWSKSIYLVSWKHLSWKRRLRYVRQRQPLSPSAVLPCDRYRRSSGPPARHWTPPRAAPDTRS